MELRALCGLARFHIFRFPPRLAGAWLPDRRTHQSGHHHEVHDAHEGSSLRFPRAPRVPVVSLVDAPVAGREEEVT